MATAPVVVVGSLDSTFPRDTPVLLWPALILALLCVWLLPIVPGIRAARRKGRSPHWMWFAVHPLGGWITWLVLSLVPEKGHMRTFAVYHHPREGYEAVKQGFSWPGFWFPVIWPFLKKLYTTAIALLIGLFLLRILPSEAQLTVFAVLAVLVSLIVGFKGNEWRATSLRGRGYRLAETLQAESPKAANARAIQLEAAKGISPTREDQRTAA